MLYGNESISQYTRGNFFIWMMMAFQAGIINIGGFMACHRFVSHVTGFATFFGNEVSLKENGHPLSMLTVPLFFLFGSMLSGFLVDIRLKLHLKPKYYMAFGLMFFLISLVLVTGTMGYFGIFGEPYEYLHDSVLLALLCLICGIQNGTITSVSKYVIRTTHLTGVTTDLGVGLVRFFSRKILKDAYINESPANLMRVGIILFFLAGSTLGGFVFKNLGYLGFTLPTVIYGIFFVLMYYHQVVKPKAHN